MTAAIRRARPEEAGALTALALRSKRSNGHDDAFMAACAAELQVTAAMLEAGACFVAAADGAVQGFVLLEAEGEGGEGEGEISAFFIDPERKRRGLGRLLWRAAEAEARRLGLRSLRLDADPEAEGFCRRRGFRTVGRAPSASIPGRDLPRMRLALER